MEQQKIWLWQHYASRITPGVQRVVEFAKRVPGFCEFSQDDQLILIKLGFFEVWISHVSKLSTESTLTFDDGSYFSKSQLELLYDVSVVIYFHTKYCNLVFAGKIEIIDHKHYYAHIQFEMIFGRKKRTTSFLKKMCTQKRTNEIPEGFSVTK